MVLCSGSFDGLHAGHIRYLREAHTLDPKHPLAVAVAPDSYTRSAKGREPHWTQADRAETLGSLWPVLRVYLQVDDSVAGTILGLRPQVFVKGRDWEGKLPIDVLWACEAVNCRIVYVDTPGRHVSETR